MNYRSLTQSRAAALVKVELYLADLPRYSVELPAQQRGETEYIVVSHTCNHHGMAGEINLEIPAGGYSAVTGCRAYKARKTLFSQEQLKTYGSLEQGLIDYGLSLCADRPAALAFYQKYAEPYNQRLKAKAHASQP